MRNRVIGVGVSTVCVLSWLSAGAAAAGPAFPAEQIEFFEKEVRPIFVEHCQECHSPAKRSGGLTIASRDLLLKGGDTGPSILPGNPDESELILAVRYDPSGYQMPPDGKLPDELIATLTRWVEMGAPWPDEEGIAAAGGEAFDLQQRAERWSFQPLQEITPPVPHRTDWARTPIDAFLLHSLAAAGLSPAGEADRRTWLRRVSLDTIGLPPSPAEVAAFLADEAPGAAERVVDRLLASPHFGERWGRHWLDLVRYAESRGHEFDYDVANPSHYRDYVIAALNEDVPYDQFVVEHVAGDLLQASGVQFLQEGGGALQPVKSGDGARYALRPDPLTGANQSIVGTGFWFFGEWVHSPVDIRQEEAERFENMIDVYSKTFLGLTVACARCHDHKFDPIRQQDYYALQGYLQSSAYRQARFETMEHNRRIAAELDNLNEFGALLLQVMTGAVKIPDDVAAIFEASVGDPAAPRFAEDTEVIVDYAQPDAPFLPDGVTFGTRPVRPGDVRLSDDPERPIARVVTVAAAERDPIWNGLELDAATRDDPARLEGWRRAGRTLRTPTFEIQSPRAYALIRGGCNAYVAVDSHIVINGPLHGSLLSEHPAQPGWRWITLDMARYIGHGAHIEFVARGDEPLSIRMVVQSSSMPEGADPGESREAARAAWIIEHAAECGLETPEIRQRLAEIAESSIHERRELLSQIQWRSATAPAMIDASGADEYVFVRGNWKKRGETVPRRFLEVFGDGDETRDRTTSDNGHAPRNAAPRGDFVDVLDSIRPEVSVVTVAPSGGSGRLELALQMIDPEQTPIVPRVIVNRIWQHYFGSGLVPTSDDFGYMGADPTHPELLDWLAGELVRHDWSLKHIHRTILLSAAYRMESRRSLDGPPPGEVDPYEVDPTNRLLHHMPIKRLEGEIIRDQILAVSGRLDDRLYGRSVPVHLTPFLEGRGRPGESGPVDGQGRRSLYISVRRNFPDPFFQAFDFPTRTRQSAAAAFPTLRRRALMNNPFIVEQSRGCPPAG